ncbi:MAG: glycerol kinase [Desulfobacterales bacterium RIFOXYA12_FULL_46_15]|nr:MAG: glycerol kinase [Desulfobacterales bacterium RIFOXYA12_FULL_46_15]
MTQYIGAIDQGTTSTRFMIIDKQGNVIAAAGKEHDQICKQPGWVEHDPVRIWKNTKAVIEEGLEAAGIQGKDLAAVGITNQRETIVAWDRTTGKPYFNAIVWQCTRSDKICEELIKEGGQDRFRSKTGLPVATYFSGSKIKWLIDTLPKVKAGVENGRAFFGTMDTWLIWNLTGGPDGGHHITDVTNASRTLLMNLETLQWDQDILSIFKIPSHTLPAIVPSSDSSAFGATKKQGPFKAALPIGGALGDQQAALFGQTCFDAGEAKNTYGTGCFFLFNMGQKIQFSNHGLLTTPAYQISGQTPCYALEGSIAYAGALVQWVRDNLGLIKKSSDIEALAKTVTDNGDVYCVPAFSGLFAPWWRSDARGVIAGLTRFANKGHLARAVLEATAFQTKDIVDAVKKEFKGRLDLKSLKVDGGMVENELLMQFQADILNTAVIRPRVSETTALGAAYAAGLAVGFWSDLKDLKKNWAVHSTYVPEKDAEWRETLSAGWEKAVQRTLNWK